MPVILDLTGNQIKADSFTGSNGAVVTIGDPTSLVSFTDNSGGTASDTIAAISATPTQAEVANAVASLAKKIDDIINILKDA